MPDFRQFLFCILLLTGDSIAAAEPVPDQSNQQSAWGSWLSGQWQRLQSNFKPQAGESYQPTFSARPRVDSQEYVVGIHPLHNPKRLFEVYGPIVDAINAKIPERHFKLEASRNYEEFERKLYAGHFDFAMPNPLQTIKSLDHGYRVFGKMADDAEFRGIILVRRDGGIQNINDLKGKAVSYPAKTALAATMMPQYYLQTHGLDINTDIENRYVGSQESAIMNLLLGHVSAAAIWPVPWNTFRAENPEQAAQLEVKWQTEPLQNNAWVVRNDVPLPLAEKFATVLFSLQDSAAGQKLLAAVPVSRFETANDQTYTPVKTFLKTFVQTVRALE